MIQVKFRTNLDNVDLSGCPKYLSCRPEKGDYIEAIINGQVRWLKVTGMIIHTMIGNNPGLEIELNK